MFQTLLLIIHNKKWQWQDNWGMEWIICKQVMAEECLICKQVMAEECPILVVQRSSTWLSEYILISLDFLFSAKFIIVKESYVNIIFLIIFGSSPRRKVHTGLILCKKTLLLHLTVTLHKNILFLCPLSIFFSFFCVLLFVFVFWSTEKTNKNLWGLTLLPHSKSTKQVTLSNKHRNRLFWV